MDYTIFNSIFQPSFSKAHNIGDMVLNIETNFVYFGDRDITFANIIDGTKWHDRWIGLTGKGSDRG